MKQPTALKLFSGTGILLYFAGIALYLFGGADGLETVALSALVILNWLAALIVLTGIIIGLLPSAHPAKRQLAARRWRVSGLLAGGAVSLAAAAIDLRFGFETGLCLAAQCLACGGALLGGLCGLFLPPSPPSETGN